MSPRQSGLPWFRFYDEVADDPKVQKLAPPVFKVWINLLCLANRGMPRGFVQGPVEDLAFSLRLDVSEAAVSIKELEQAGLLEAVEVDPHRLGWTPHSWSERQFDWDDSTQRWRNWKARQSSPPTPKPPTNVGTNVPDNVSTTLAQTLESPNSNVSSNVGTNVGPNVPSNVRDTETDKDKDSEKDIYILPQKVPVDREDDVSTGEESDWNALSEELSPVKYQAALPTQRPGRGRGTSEEGVPELLRGAEGFELFWTKHYPRDSEGHPQGNKAASKRHWTAMSVGERRDVHLSLDVYRRTKKVKEGFVMSAQRYLAGEYKEFMPRAAGFSGIEQKVPVDREAILERSEALAVNGSSSAPPIPQKTNLHKCPYEGCTNTTAHKYCSVHGVFPRFAELKEEFHEGKQREEDLF